MRECPCSHPVSNRIIISRTKHQEEEFTSAAYTYDTSDTHKWYWCTRFSAGGVQGVVCQALAGELKGTWFIFKQTCKLLVTFPAVTIGRSILFQWCCGFMFELKKSVSGFCVYKSHL